MVGFASGPKPLSHPHIKASRASAYRGSVVAALALAAIALTACGQRQRPPTPAPAPIVAAAPGAAPPPAASYTLIITWLPTDQSPSTSQTVFHDAAACERGRQAALAEGQRLASDAAAAFATASAQYAATAHRYVGETAIGATDAPPVMAAVPKVTALCAGS